MVRVRFLEVEHIIILGHTQCGGIKALFENADKVSDKKSHNFIDKWLEIARPAYDRVVSEHGNASFKEKVILCEQYALINSLHNLYTFDWVQERIDNGMLLVHAWYLDLATGAVHMYDQQRKVWLDEVKN